MVFNPIKLSDLETPKLSFGEFLLQYCRKRAAEGKTALIWADKGIHISYEDLLRDAVRMATGLQAIGAKCGDTMAIVARNSPQLFSIVVGALFNGLKVAPSVAEFGAMELRLNFATTKPKYILTQPEKAPDVEEALSNCDPRPEIILLEESTFNEILEKGSQANPDSFQTAKIEDPSQNEFAYCFSSGTTGIQKAIAQIDYYFLKNNFMSIAPMLKHRGPYLNTSQINWATWFYTLTGCLIADRPWMFATKNDLDSILHYIHNHKPESYFCPPSIIYAISDAMEQHPGRWDLSSLKAIFTCGDRFGADAQRELSEKLKVKIYQEYGCTEVGFITIADLDKDPVYGSAGKITIEVKLVNPDTQVEITERNKLGEIRLKKVVTNGYLGDPKRTAEAFDSQGWFKSGDLGYITENNDLFISDRMKEMLKYKGHQVAPGELEDIIKQIPGVADVAVGGKNDDIAGSLITAIVVKKPGWDVTEQDVKNFLEKKNLHDSKQLRGGVMFVENLPKNANGKLARRNVTKMLNPTVK